jgi:dTDP-4-amino-4,6-dideoxygalactose transaminase
MYGSNYRLSEWQGAVLRQQLSRLDAQAEVRTRNAKYLNSELPSVAGITPQALDPRCTRNGHYAYIIHYDSSSFGGVSIERFIQALNAEGIPTQASYPPIHELDLFADGEYLQRICKHLRGEKPSFLQAEYDRTARGAWETVWLPQPVLLGSEEEMSQVVEAMLKIQRNVTTLVD